MMRLVLAALVVCTLAGPAAASAQEIGVGLKGGFVSSTVSTKGTGAFEPEADASTALGGFVTVDFGSRGRFQPEILFAWRRFSLVELDEYSVRSRGVEIPLPFGVTLATEGRLRPVVFAGPQFSVISKVTQSSEGVETDFSDNVKNIDVAAVIGGGLDIDAGRGALTLDVRGIVGLKNLSENPALTIKSRAFMALVGYRF